MYTVKDSTTFLTVLLIVGTTLLAAPSNADTQSSDHPGTSMMSGEMGAADHDDASGQGMTAPAADAHPFEKQIYAAMTRMMSDMQASGYTGNWDIDFMAMMIPHHQGAIDMAKLVLEYGKDPTVRRMAGQIITDQREEIALMTKHMDALRQQEMNRQGTSGGGNPQ